MSADLTGRQESFRAAMAAVCTPVAVVTNAEDGLPNGTTVSAFTSLSMNPPMILVSLDKGSDLLSKVPRIGTFGLNVLASGQSALARRFATKGPEKVRGVDWWNEFGRARLRAVAAWVACTVGRIVEGGDHLVQVANVVSAEAAEIEPLTYYARTFGTRLPHAEVS